jgi:hypothetical protein
MAKNDVVLVDTILQGRRADRYPSDDPGEVFELFAFEQVLKPFDLSQDEIEHGWIDGRDDAGMDGFFVFVNGRLVQDPNTFAWPRRNTEIEVRIINCKHHETFQQAPLNTLLANVPELFDLAIERNALRGSYSEELLEARDTFFEVVRQLSVTRPMLNFEFLYASRGDATAVAVNVQATAKQLESAIHSLFSDCTVRVSFVGAGELLTMYRTTRSFALNLPIIEYLTGGPASYVALARLDQFARFVTDEDGNLRRYLFDSNVRDYLGESGVNQDISASLGDASTPDFWWLNNGITILATGAAVVGKEIQLQDIQIVNGLQTTETVFRAFQEHRVQRPERAVLVKIIVSSDESVRDSIIRATNNQSIVETAALRATDKIQRDIEQALERHDWYYERRKNYYRNVGKPLARFVTPMYIAAGCVALVMKNPAEAATLRSRFMRSDDSYHRVFDPDLPLNVWVTIAELLKKVEAGLSTVRPERTHEGERFLANWRNLVAFLVACRAIGRFSYEADNLAKLDVRAIPESAIVEVWVVIQGVQSVIGKRTYRNPGFVRRCLEEVATQFGVQHLAALTRKRVAPPASKTAPRSLVSDELVDSVDAALPQQPWKPGVHREVAKAIHKRPDDVTAAIQRLIELGRRNQQRDGVVYDEAGNVLAVDSDRSPPSK